MPIVRVVLVGWLLVVFAPVLNAGTMSLRWGSVQGAAGYRVYWGTSPRQYTKTTTVTGTSATLTVGDDTTWYVGVKAFNSNGLESSTYSNEVAGLARPTVTSVIPSRGAVGQRMTVTQFIADQEIRTEVFDALRRVLDRYDLLVSPTLACVAVDNATDGNTVGPAEIEGESVDRLIGWCMTYLINFIGYPAATVPAGLAANGLPVGMQIVGKRYADADVIAASAEFERLRPWMDTYRSCRL